MCLCSGALERSIKDLEKQAFELAGKTFNLSSSEQVSNVLFKNLKLPVPPNARPIKDFFSTGAEVSRLICDQYCELTRCTGIDIIMPYVLQVLEQVLGDHKLPGIILDHRSKSKLLHGFAETICSKMRQLEVSKGEGLPVFIHPQQFETVCCDDVSCLATA